MQTTLLPRGICNAIDGLIRKNLWRRAKGKQKVHLINWNTVTTEKEKGGLGIKKMGTMNLALMAKLWAKVINSKYMKGEASTPKLFQKK